MLLTILGKISNSSVIKCDITTLTADVTELVAIAVSNFYGDIILTRNISRMLFSGPAPIDLVENS